MDKCHYWHIGSMWCKDLPHKIYVGHWPTFHGPVILSEDYLNVVLEVPKAWGGASVYLGHISSLLLQL